MLPDNAEKTVALRKLLEAKDCAVRAVLYRRDFLRGVGATLAGMSALPGVKIVGAEPPRPQPAVATPSAIDTDVSVAVRQWFVNWTPVVSRSLWVPIDLPGFRLFNCRYGEPPDEGSTWQDCQDFQMPVGVGGDPCLPFMMPDGSSSPFSFEKTMQLRNLISDIETSIYYGRGSDSAVRMQGLRSLLRTNRIERAYPGDEVPLDFFIEAIARSRVNGGEPNLVLLASNLIGKSPSLKLRHVEAGTTAFGKPIHVYESGPLAGDGQYLSRLVFVESPLLRPGTAVVLDSREVCVRNRVNPHWSPRPPGGNCEGDWKCSLAVAVVNESHHCWAEAKVA